MEQPTDSQETSCSKLRNKLGPFNNLVAVVRDTDHLLIAKLTAENCDVDEMIEALSGVEAEVERLSSYSKAQAEYIAFLEQECIMAEINFGEVGTVIANDYLTKIALLSPPVDPKTKEI